MEQNQFKSFLGTGWSFPPQFNKATKSVAMIADENDIQNSLQILLSTQVGERIMQPRYGCDLTDIIFEPLDVGLQTYIKDLVFTAIFYFEPRIKPDDVKLEPQEEEGVVLVIVEYTIRATNTRHNVVYPFYIEEGNLVNK